MRDAGESGSMPLARGSAVMFLAIVGTGGLGILISITIARLVGVGDFGIYSILVSIQGVFVLAATFGLSSAAGKFVAEYRKRDPALVGRYAKTALVLGVLSSSISLVIYVALSHFIGVDLYGEHAIVDLIPFSALVMVALAFHSFAVGLMQGFQRMKMLAFFQVGVPIVNIAIVVPLVAFFGLQGAFISAFIAQISTLVAGFYMIHSRLVPFSRGEVHILKDEVAKKLLNFALPGVIAGFLVAPVYWIGNTELVLTSGFDAMGLMAVALVFFNALSLIPQAIVIPLMPRVSELSVTTPEQVGMMVSKALRYVALFAFPLSLGIALYDEQIVTFFYGASYAHTSDAMYLLVAAAYFTQTASIIGGMITGLGRMWLALGMSLAWALSFIGLTFLFVPAYGPLGLGASYAVSYAFLMIVDFAVVRGVLKQDIASAIPSVLVPAVFFVGGFLVFVLTPDLRLIVASIILVMGIIASLFVSRKDLNQIIGHIRSMLP